CGAAAALAQSGSRCDVPSYASLAPPSPPCIHTAGRRLSFALRRGGLRAGCCVGSVGVSLRRTVVRLTRPSFAALHPTRRTTLIVCASPRRPAGRLLRWLSRGLAATYRRTPHSPLLRRLASNPQDDAYRLRFAAAACGPAAALAQSGSRCDVPSYASLAPPSPPCIQPAGRRL